MYNTKEYELKVGLEVESDHLGMGNLDLAGQNSYILLLDRRNEAALVSIA